MKKKLDETTREYLKMALGYDDDQLDMIEKDPTQLEMMGRLGDFAAKKFIVTCIKAENCAFNKVGDRYVFTAFGSMIKEESCETPCLWAMSQFLPFSFMIYDRIASGLDPAGMHLNHVTCPDAGCQYGGFGSSLFKITIE